MSKVLVTARLENLEDVSRAAQGTLPADQVRAVEVTDTLIDTGATGLLVPRRLLAQIADELPVIIGQVPLELMDWVVDPKRQRLIGNPEQGGEQMIDVLGEAR